MPLAHRNTLIQLSGLLLGLALCTTPLEAQAQFTPPSRGRPERREGGGTRGPACVFGKPSVLTAMVPFANNPGSTLGITTAAYPRFFWYSPKTRAPYAEFTLAKLAENGRDRIAVYQTRFALTGEPGIASLALPSDANLPPLEIGKDYNWSISLICSETNPSINIVAGGWIQRVEASPALMSQLAMESPKRRIAAYAKNGWWHDTLTAMAELQCTNSSDTEAKRQWVELMKSKNVKLDAIAEQPLLYQGCKR